MAKGFYEELLDELNELMLSEVQRVHDAVDKRERPPLAMKPSTVMKTVRQVAAHHKITGEELMGIFGAEELSAEDAIAVAKAAKQLQEQQAEA